MSILARRYVEPLFEVALEKDQLDRIAEDLSGLDEALKASADLRRFLTNPSIERHVKKTVIQKVFDGVSQYTMNFMKLVIEKNRTEILLHARQLYMNLLNAQRGMTPGVVETATPLDDATFERVRKELEVRFQTKLELERKVAKDLLGGMRVRVGNTVIDGSVQGRLARLRESLIVR